jgi:hypothetical protein
MVDVEVVLSVTTVQYSNDRKNRCIEWHSCIVALERLDDWIYWEDLGDGIQQTPLDVGRGAPKLERGRPSVKAIRLRSDSHVSNSEQQSLRWPANYYYYVSASCKPLQTTVLA